MRYDAPRLDVLAAALDALQHVEVVLDVLKGGLLGEAVEHLADFLLCGGNCVTQSTGERCRRPGFARAARAHPRSTMLIAQQTHLLAVVEGYTEIDADLIRLGAAQAQPQERSRHQTMVDRVRGLSGKKTGALALKTIKRVGGNDEIYTGATDAKAVGRAVDALRDAGFIERTEDGRRWRIRDPLLRNYLAAL